LGPEFELIAQEILDGLMINKSLLNGEGPQFATASIGIEAMITRLEQWRSELAEWVELKLYLPYAKMRNFVRENEWGEEEYIYPRIKWERMALRDQQQNRQFMLQLHEKNAISTQTLHEAFDIDYDNEISRLRYERAMNAEMGAAVGGMGANGLGGGFGGAAGGGPMGDPMGGMPGGDMGGGGMPGGGMDGAPGGAPVGAPAPGGPGGGPGLTAGTEPGMTVLAQANIKEFGGRVLTEKSREKLLKEKQRLEKQKSSTSESSGGGMTRNPNTGRFMLSRIERELFGALLNARQSNMIRHAIVPQFDVWYGSQLYTLDFAMPDLKLGIEADGGLHEYAEQIEKDKQRDAKLAKLGWTILRYTEHDIEDRLSDVIQHIVQNVDMKMQAAHAQQNPSAPSQQSDPSTS
jgi:hypothetical protein